MFASARQVSVTISEVVRNLKARGCPVRPGPRPAYVDLSKARQPQQPRVRRRVAPPTTPTTLANHRLPTPGRTTLPGSSIHRDRRRSEPGRHDVAANSNRPVGPDAVPKDHCAQDKRQHRLDDQRVGLVDPQIRRCRSQPNHIPEKIARSTTAATTEREIAADRENKRDDLLFRCGWHGESEHAKTVVGVVTQVSPH